MELLENKISVGYSFFKNGLLQYVIKTFLFFPEAGVMLLIYC